MSSKYVKCPYFLNSKDIKKGSETKNNIKVFGKLMILFSLNNP